MKEKVMLTKEQKIKRAKKMVNLIVYCVYIIMLIFIISGIILASCYLRYSDTDYLCLSIMFTDFGIFTFAFAVGALPSGKTIEEKYLKKENEDERIPKN